MTRQYTVIVRQKRPVYCQYRTKSMNKAEPNIDASEYTQSVDSRKSTACATDEAVLYSPSGDSAACVSVDKSDYSAKFHRAILESLRDCISASNSEAISGCVSARSVVSAGSFTRL